MRVVLFEPEIPQNTGNIIRLCANTGCALHLIAPLGFAWDDAKLRRAGLDYREWVSVVHHANFDDCRRHLGTAKWWPFTTKGAHSPFDVAFGPDDALLFGPETRGLPQPLLDDLGAERWLRLPMCAGSRSLNLSNAVAVAVYEAWRQQGFVTAHWPSRE